MEKRKSELLVVDDEEFNRLVLEKCLGDAGYGVTLAEDGAMAWKLLHDTPHGFSAILLDRLMPNMDGMELLRLIKSDARFQQVPVIFQTAVDDLPSIADGIKAGAFYYLTKPINKNVLLAIVQSAVTEYAMLTGMPAGDRRWEYVEPGQQIEISLRTLDEARTLAAALANFYPQPQRVLLGLSELLINAVEHGNLGISYNEKSLLLREGTWETEIGRRLALPENAGKTVSVQLELMPEDIRLIITDCGDGFAWKKYLDISPERAFDPNGRGIAMSRMISFDALEYQGKGNCVMTTVNL